MEHQYRHHQRQRYGDERDQCGAHIHKEDKQHYYYKEATFVERLLDIVDTAIYETLLTIYVGAEFHVGR